MKLTREQIEDLREGILAQPWTQEEHARGMTLCDMALSSLNEDKVLVPRKLTSAIAGALENTDGGNILTGLLDYWQPVWDAVLLAAGREE
jgi:hypothetical protein